MEYEGTKEFKAVLLNYEDETFIKVILDPESLTFFKTNLFKIKDGLSRTMVNFDFKKFKRFGVASLT